MGLPIKQVREIINEWKKQPAIQTIYKNKTRFKPEHFEELDLNLTPKLVETLNINAYGANVKMNNKIMVYIPYHNLWFALREIDPTVKFDYEILDFNEGIKTDLGYKVNGLSILVKYSSTYLPEQTQKITLAITDNKYNSIEIDKIKADDIEYTAFRAFVKTIAFNTGIGYLCWLNPEWVKQAGFLYAPANESIENWLGNEQSTLQLRQSLIAKKQALLAAEQAQQNATTQQEAKPKRSRTTKTVVQETPKEEIVAAFEAPKEEVVEQQQEEVVEVQEEVVPPAPQVYEAQEEVIQPTELPTINDPAIVDAQFKDWLMTNLEDKKVMLGNYLQTNNKKSISELTTEEKLNLMKG